MSISGRRVWNDKDNVPWILSSDNRAYDGYDIIFWAMHVNNWSIIVLAKFFNNFESWVRSELRKKQPYINWQQKI